MHIDSRDHQIPRAGPCVRPRLPEPVDRFRSAEVTSIAWYEHRMITVVQGRFCRPRAPSCWELAGTAGFTGPEPIGRHSCMQTKCIDSQPPGSAWQASRPGGSHLDLGPDRAGLGSMALAQAPGPELFAKEPRTPLELWDAVDYLLRTNQAKKALPYIDKFMKSKPDDATLIAIRNRYGPGSILRLNDDAATRPFAQPMAEAMVAAARKYATQPERIAQFVSELTKTPEEQDYAVRHLREAGPDAIPFLVEALARPDLRPMIEDLLSEHGPAGSFSDPALAAVLDSPDPALAADAATALGMIGDKEAIPFLTFPAASPEAPPAVRAAAQAAIARLTGQPFSAQPRKPVRS